jgi:hypothetical protein
MQIISHCSTDNKSGRAAMCYPVGHNPPAVGAALEALSHEPDLLLEPCEVIPLACTPRTDCQPARDKTNFLDSPRAADACLDSTAGV